MLAIRFSLTRKDADPRFPECRAELVVIRSDVGGTQDEIDADGTGPRGFQVPQQMCIIRAGPREPGGEGAEGLFRNLHDNDVRGIGRWCGGTPVLEPEVERRQFEAFKQAEREDGDAGEDKNDGGDADGERKTRCDAAASCEKRRDAHRVTCGLKCRIGTAGSRSCRPECRRCHSS